MGTLYSHYPIRRDSGRLESLMASIEYSYSIHEALDAMIDNELSKNRWSQIGKPCVLVEYTTPLLKGSFVVHKDELEAFAEKPINVENVYEVLEIFEEMLKAENYVENHFLGDVEYLLCSTMDPLGYRRKR